MPVSCRHFLFLFFFLVLGSVFSFGLLDNSAVQASANPNGIQIENPKFEYYPYTTFNLNIHAYDSNNSILTNSTTNCSIHLYNNLGNNLMSERLKFSSGDSNFYSTVNKSLIPPDETYSVLWDCKNSIESGFLSTSFTITEKGKPTQNNNYVWNIILGLVVAILLIIFGIHNEDISMTSLGGIACIILGVYMAINGILFINTIVSQAVSIILILFGAYVFIRPNLEEIKRILP